MRLERAPGIGARALPASASEGHKLPFCAGQPGRLLGRLFVFCKYVYVCSQMPGLRAAEAEGWDPCQ